MSLWSGNVPLEIYNHCPDTLWPAIFTTSGGGPSTGGFELAAGANKSLEVDANWYGRVWARTNCTSSDDAFICQTGSCGVLDCAALAGNPPATLAEFNLAGGTGAAQNFVDLSLVDGYNIPVGLTYIADPTAANQTAPPPNLVSPACIATAGYLAAPARSGLVNTNATYPMPYEAAQTSARVGHWCPWSLQRPTPEKPGAGVYPYPDDGVARPTFDPCLSACHATGRARDCCTDAYDTPDACPRSDYARAAKRVCPDAYSYPYDDGASTFVLPGGGGWRVTFCPAGRSTNILATFGSQINEWAATGVMSADILAVASNTTFIATHGAAAPRDVGGGLKVVVAATLVSVLVVHGL